MREALIASNFRGFLPVEFPEITAADGWFRFVELSVVINGQARPFQRVDEKWKPEQRNKPPKTFHPIYKIPADWLGDLTVDSVIEIKVQTVIFYLKPADSPTEMGLKNSNINCKLRVVPPPKP
jgi:hypothetical protein